MAGFIKGVGRRIRSVGFVVSIFRIKEFTKASFRRNLWRARGPMNFSMGQSMSEGLGWGNLRAMANISKKMIVSIRVSGVGIRKMVRGNFGGRMGTGTLVSGSRTH
jgi:hypothetical protein